MASFREYTTFDGIGLANLVKNGDVSAKELLDCAISRAQDFDQKINFMTLPMFDEGRQNLERLKDGPFTGVPFLLKDLLGHYKGYPTSCGSECLKNFVMKKDSELVKRYKNSGLNIFGKTSCPEFGLMGITEPKAFGPTRNPWDLSRTPGGSSGGSAAAVASRVVPMASAGDGGGSIRIPAACCGIFGLKPSRGRVPCGPDYGELWEGAVQEGVLSITVRDSAAMLDVIKGAEPGSPYIIAENTKSYLELLNRPSKKLKIGMMSESPMGGPVDPNYKEMLLKASKEIEGMGHTVEFADPKIDGKLLAQVYITMYMGQVATDLTHVSKLLNTPVSRLKVEKVTRLFGLLGRSVTAHKYALAKRTWHHFMMQMAKFHQIYDLFMTPTLASTPSFIGEMDLTFIEKLFIDLICGIRAGKLMLATGIVEKLAEKNFEKVPFTTLANITGQPAMSVPMYWDNNSLPFGVHFMAPLGREDLLFPLAHDLEQNLKWTSKMPQSNLEI